MFKRVINARVRKSELIQVEGMKRGTRRSIIALIEAIKNELSINEVIESMT